MIDRSTVSSCSTENNYAIMHLLGVIQSVLYPFQQVRSFPFRFGTGTVPGIVTNPLYSSYDKVQCCGDCCHFFAVPVRPAVICDLCLVTRLLFRKRLNNRNTEQ